MQPIDPLAGLLHDWGWTGVILYLLASKGLPWLLDTFWPERMKAKLAEAERKAKQEERQICASERLNDLVNALTTQLTIHNERINTVLDDTGYMRTGVTKLLERKELAEAAPIKGKAKAQ